MSGPLPGPSGRRFARAWRALAIVAVVGLLAVLPVADDLGEGHVDAAFKRALLGYAVARGLNGAISVAQGTEVAVQPAGIGVNFAPGEILDPINDLVERFSWIMMLAASSLGVQKVLLAMSGWAGLAAAVVAVGILWALALAARESPRGPGAKGLGRFVPSARAVRAAGRVFLFLAVLRFVMPVIAIGNDWVYRTFLERDYVEASAELERARETLGELEAEGGLAVPPSDDVADGTGDDGEATGSAPGDGAQGFIDRARSLYRGAIAGVDVQARLERYAAAAESVSENTIRLIVVFVMQTVVFPLLFLVVLWGVLRRIVRR